MYIEAPLKADTQLSEACKPSMDFLQVSSTAMVVRPLVRMKLGWAFMGAALQASKTIGMASTHGLACATKEKFVTAWIHAAMKPK